MFFADYAAYELFCGDSSSGYCQDLGEGLIDRYVYDMINCGYFTSMNIKGATPDKSSYAKSFKYSLEVNSSKKEIGAKMLPSD